MTFASLLVLWLAAHAPQCTIAAEPSPQGVVLSDGSVAAWGADCGPQPSSAAVMDEAAELLRPRCIGRLDEARRAALDTRRATTWPGLSAGEVSEAMAAGEPTPAVVADYLSDRAGILAAYQAQVAIAATLGADAAWNCAQTGALP